MQAKFYLALLCCIMLMFCKGNVNSKYQSSTMYICSVPDPDLEIIGGGGGGDGHPDPLIRGGPGLQKIFFGPVWSVGGGGGWGRQAPPLDSPLMLSLITELTLESAIQL